MTDPVGTGAARAVAYDRAGLADSDPDLPTLSTEGTVADLSGLINVRGSGHAVPLDRPALAAEAILTCVQ
jgi:hypothetical protein